MFKKLTVSLTALAFSLLLLSGCSGGRISVSFTLIGDAIHGKEEHSQYAAWIKDNGWNGEKDATALYVITSVMEEAGYSFEDESYIYSVTRPDGVTLNAGDNGESSGWLFAVNGRIPDVGMNEYALKDGDHIELRYVDDFNAEVDWNTSMFIS